jgi:hypothetical protein
VAQGTAKRVEATAPDPALMRLAEALARFNAKRDKEAARHGQDGETRKPTNGRR